MSGDGRALHPDICKVLFSLEQIAERTRQLGQQLAAEYSGQSLLVLCVLKGSFMFTAGGL